LSEKLEKMKTKKEDFFQFFFIHNVQPYYNGAHIRVHCDHPKDCAGYKATLCLVFFTPPVPPTASEVLPPRRVR
jgi:hypothetical protein